jgi:hypothetical protein
MSFQTFCGQDPTDADTYQKVLGKFMEGGAAGAMTLGAVLENGNSAFSPTTGLAQDATDFDLLGCKEIATGKVYQGNNLSLTIGEPTDTLKLKGAITKGSINVGNGVITESLPVGANGLVLKANSGAATGVAWEVDGTSGITGVSAGTNISVDNTNPLVPIINFATPTTSNIQLGVGTEILATSGFTTMSIDSTGLNDKYLNGLVENKEDIAVDATSVVETISTTDGTTYQNTSLITCNTTGISDIKTATNLTSTSYGASTISCLPNSVIMGVGCVIPNSPANIDGSITLQTSPTDPQLSLSQSAPFAASYSTIINKDGITQNNSGGAGFTINTNNSPCNIQNTSTIGIFAGSNISISAPSGTITSTSSTGQQVVVSSANNVSTPTLTITNSNASITSYPVIKTDRPTPASVAGDVIGAISTWADDGAGTNREWSRIQTKTENVSGGNQDATLSIFTSVNGVVSEVFNFNGAQNENNSFRPLDMNGNNIRTTSGDMVITSYTSSGTGNMSITAKGYGQYGAETGFTNIYNTNGNITFNAGGAASDLEFNCANWESATSGGNSGQHLRIKLNGTYYKIALQND